MPYLFDLPERNNELLHNLLILLRHRSHSIIKSKAIGTIKSK